jgi:hypothetical protein
VSAVTVGDLRALLADPNLPDDRVVAIDTGHEDEPFWVIREAGVWASDTYLPPFGTDPMVEATTGSLELVVGPEEEC